MMIAEKLLGCCSSPVDPQNTVFLAFAQSPAGGAPEAIIGQLSAGHAGVALNGAGGAIVQSDGYATYTTPPAASFGAGDFLLDVVFDGTTPPDVTAMLSFSLAIFNGILCVSTSGSAWDYFIPISPPPGQNHVAVGRQAGVVQAWLNGSRVFRAADAATGADPISIIEVRPQPGASADMTVHSVRICYGVDLYGDNANIAVPTLPLGIV